VTAREPRVHVMLPPRTAAAAKRLQSERGAETLTDVVASAVQVVSEIVRLLSGSEGAVLALVNRRAGTYAELSIPSLAKSAVNLAPFQALAPELPPDLFEPAPFPVASQNQGLAPSAMPLDSTKAERRAVALALLEQTGTAARLAQPPEKMRGPNDRPGRTLMSVDEVAKMLFKSEAQVMAALKNGEYDGAELVDGEWWIPQSEVKVRR
jgi:hypothetical protein